MATSIEHRLQIEAAVKKAGIIFGMGHGVLLLPPAQRMFLSPIILNENVVSAAVFASAVTQVVRSGKLGQLVNAQHIEPVGRWHFAHSHVCVERERR
jgi:hypothetical protein